MLITLNNVTEEQLEKLLKLTGDDKELEGLHWQLRGHWITGGDDQPAIEPGPRLTKICR